MFTWKHVNTLFRAVRANLRMPHEFVCVTDDPLKLDPAIRAVPMPEFPVVAGERDLCNEDGGPYGCFVRLKAFDAQWSRENLGERFVMLDVDTVITGDLTPLFDRDEDFVGWMDEPLTDGLRYQGGLFMMNAGARPQVLDTFDPATVMARIAETDLFGTDQAWLTMCLYPHEETWSRPDGVYKGEQCIKGFPSNCRIMFPTGAYKPWAVLTKRERPHLHQAWSRYA